MVEAIHKYDFGFEIKSVYFVDQKKKNIATFLGMRFV